ncbi:hypothetical protein FQR65_LT05965 [Abscondita terminalis]|nr:hypothetical protein FQR65_LT05965 [Abscondita terminalis]
MVTKKLFVFSSILFSIVATLPNSHGLEAFGLSSKINLGQPATEAQFPWQALIEFQTSSGWFICAGALIDPRWVVTAARCAYGAQQFKITLEFVQVIPLATVQLLVGAPVTVSGWGKISDQSNVLSPTLNFANLSTIINENCRAIYGSLINDGSLCCDGKPQHSTCDGDSGSPLVQYRSDGVYHTGVANFFHVSGCASGNPSVYARTSYYRTWILDTISKN